MARKSRRDFLQAAAASLGGAAGMGVFPETIQQLLAMPAHNPTGSIKDIEHVIILMQENRSFDHYYGTLRGVRGFSDPHPISLPTGQPVFNQAEGATVVPPFRPDV